MTTQTVYLNLYDSNGKFVRRIPFQGGTYRGAVRAAIAFAFNWTSYKEWNVIETEGKPRLFWTHSYNTREATEQEIEEALNRIYTQHDAKEG